MAIALNGLGTVALFLEGDPAAARIPYQESLDLFLSVGDRHGASYALTGLGRCARAATKDRRMASSAKAPNSAANCATRVGIAESLEGLGAVAGARADVERAARIWGAVERLREKIGNSLSPAERLAHDGQVAAVRALHDDAEGFVRAWQEGRAMKVGDAIAYALDSDDRGAGPQDLRASPLQAGVQAQSRD